MVVECSLFLKLNESEQDAADMPFAFISSAALLHVQLVRFLVCHDLIVTYL